MVKYATLRKEQGKGQIFEGVQMKMAQLVNKSISITDISNILTGEFGDFKIVQAKLGNKLITFPVNSRTAVYKDLEFMKTSTEKKQAVDTKIIKVKSKSNKGRAYYQFS